MRSTTIFVAAVAGAAVASAKTASRAASRCRVFMAVPPVLGLPCFLTRQQCRDCAGFVPTPSGGLPRVASMAPISFARGIPAPELLPAADLAECARAAIERGGADVLNYGPAGGYRPLRELIARTHR